MKPVLEIRKGTNQVIEDFSIVLQDVVRWMNSTGRSLWPSEQVSADGLLNSYKPEEIHAGYINNSPVAGMVVQQEDTFFWPHIPGSESLFIHKLAVLRKFKDQGISSLMIEWITAQAIDQGKKYLRLDCDAGRPKLCKFYEDLGFVNVKRNMVGIYDICLFEMKLI